MPSTITKGCLIIKSHSNNLAIDVYSELLQTKNVSYRHCTHQYSTEDSIIVDDEVFNKIMLYVKMGSYAGLKLHEFLDKMCSKIQ